ncbi:MAG: ATP-binding cassette domain-containing protein [Thermoanaerobacteraceae bacterium]|uniref:energy-coupling factor ABC transporter ATP-binding protein n=1 Tax=Thermanaeromonas sp. C210 TaxID=2731925 RepID=UPI00155C777E|nr:ATP-binding cassette domain-containing protein [Thermanaeromonas sp. C210]MBE3580280.1 ATP-binding cassette domain-containing protein [Thermoanaerobacteraceae bacterium]GFN22887.1 energy-coupling factor ABC transporter ATP-binding protein [Thermanaeromonas sp. C210]
MDPVIEVQDFTFYYGESQVPALAGLNLVVRQGEFLGVTGPTGAGKTTLALALNGVIPHFQGGRWSGRVVVAGLDTSETPCSRLARVIGSVFQDPEAQLVATEVEEELAFGLENQGLPREEMLRRIDEALTMVGIRELRRRSLKELSGGQKQRVAIAAAVAMRPAVLVLDEPTSELDPQGTLEVMEVLRLLNRDHRLTIVLLEQKLAAMAPYISRLVCLHKGRIVADAPPREILRREKLLQELGLEEPPVAAFFRLLRRAGLYTQDLPLTVEEGREELGRLLGKEGIP